MSKDFLRLCCVVGLRVKLATSKWTTWLENELEMSQGGSASVYRVKGQYVRRMEIDKGRALRISNFP